MSLQHPHLTRGANGAQLAAAAAVLYPDATTPHAWHRRLARELHMTRQGVAAWHANRRRVPGPAIAAINALLTLRRLIRE